MRYACVVLMIALSGCGLSPSYMAAQHEAEMSRYRASCEKLGFVGKESAECALRTFEAQRGGVVNVR